MKANRSLKVASVGAPETALHPCSGREVARTGLIRVSWRGSVSQKRRVLTPVHPGWLVSRSHARKTGIISFATPPPLQTSTKIPNDSVCGIGSGRFKRGGRARVSQGDKALCPTN